MWESNPPQQVKSLLLTRHSANLPGVPAVGFEPTPLWILSSLPLPIGLCGQTFGATEEIRTLRTCSLNAVRIPIPSQWHFTKSCTPDGIRTRTFSGLSGTTPTNWSTGVWWCSRDDSNVHCTVSQTVLSTKLEYVSKLAHPQGIEPRSSGS